MGTTNTNYQLFINATLKLAQTMVIKSTEAALLLNERLAQLGLGDTFDPLSPETWKYYKNLAGEYHSTDTVMTVVSMDTLETIVFSKENLALHRATARGYEFGTRQYRELVARYPNQWMLIRGILYPTDITKAIDAENGAILNYAPGLVEVNEYSLISRLQKWLDGWRARWINPQFGLTDSLYYATMFGIMYTKLFEAIIAYRLEACKTNEAHSFHVRQYLASHGKLDVYLDHLTTKQSLWLYRNIVYIEANFGKQDTFDWLVEHIMTERKLPLAEYTMRHDVSEQPTEIYPTVTFKKTAINKALNANYQENFTLEQVLAKEDSFARSNPAERLEVAPVMRKMMRNSLSSVVATKVLESSVVDRNNNSPWTLNDILLHHWLYLASEGLYTAFVGIDDPVSGERIPLSVKDAYVFLWYAFAKSNGIELLEIPPMLATRVQRIPMPTVDDLMSVVDEKRVSVDKAIAALSQQPVIEPIISTEAFYNKCVEIFNAAQFQRKLISLEEGSLARGMTYGLVSRIYCDKLCRVSLAGETYPEWFAERNIVISNYTIADLGLIYVNIVREATGMNLTTKKSLKDLQAAMVKIMGQLSSYSVQFNTEINSSEIMVTDWTAVRVDRFDAKLKNLVYVDGAAPEVKETHSKLHDKQRLDVNEFVMTTVHSSLNDKIELTLPSPFPKAAGRYISHIHMDTAPIRFTPSPKLEPNARGVIPVMGIVEWLAMPLAFQADMVDVYGSKVGYGSDQIVDPSNDPPLSEALPVNYLSGLVYIPAPPTNVDISQVINVRQLDGFDRTE